MSDSPFKTVICALDLADESREALRLAARVAETASARLVVAHAEPAPVTPGLSAARHGAERLTETELEHGRGLLRDVVATVLGSSNTQPVEYHVAFGDPAASVIELARTSEAPLLVIGSRGRGALRSLLFGSVSTNVVNAAPCPVLVVPQAAISA